MARTIGLTVLLVALAGQAMAHSGHDESGFLHPFTGIDHVLAAVGVVVHEGALEDDAPVRALAAVVGQALEQRAGVGVRGVGLETDRVVADLLVATFETVHLVDRRRLVPADLAIAVSFARVVSP